MSIDDIPAPPALTVELWRSVLHDAVDEALDQILLTAEAEWESEWDSEYADVDDEWWPGAAHDRCDEADEPPGDPPDVAEIADLSSSLRAGLAGTIDRGVAVWGCDGTLRCTRAFTEQILDEADLAIDAYRRRGLHCDCAVLRTVLGRTDNLPRCGGEHRS